jgi:hypothetical protein
MTRPSRADDQGAMQRSCSDGQNFRTPDTAHFHYPTYIPSDIVLRARSRDLEVTPHPICGDVVSVTSNLLGSSP